MPTESESGYYHIYFPRVQDVTRRGSGLRRCHLLSKFISSGNHARREKSGQLVLLHGAKYLPSSGTAKPVSRDRFAMERT